ncbi:hypothetical protein Tco_1094343 [Tanacetum coccineum]|uniref:Uncharacterized protein n=1 Tax=Tanacetum coccineum TaxID=301880 RepID=A0ABQ5IF94_9ASTR
MEAYPYLDNGIYDIVDRVMHPLALKQTRRPQSDRGKAHHSVSSSSSYHHGMSSHQHDDDDDVETSRASVESFEEVDISFLSVEVVKVCLMKDMGHDGRACIYAAIVSVDTNDILTNDEFPILDVGRKIILEE